jgi:protoporphyrin/coproporphyrin ferrochelatase
MTMAAIVRPRKTSSEIRRGGVGAIGGHYIVKTVPQPFDAVLVIAFGGPQGPEDIRPFLANVLRGRRVAPERVEEVAHHYELFGGVSPLTALTKQQAEGLQRVLAARGVELPVYVGMRNWHPFLKDTLAEMRRDGVRRAVGFIAAAHRSYSSCLQYKENVRDAGGGVELVYAGDWHTQPGFVRANAEHIAEAFGRLPAEARERAELVFTAHSIPVSMAQRYPYERQIRESCDAVASGLSRKYTLVYQSRSGRPEDPWLGPDICEYLRTAHARGVSGVVISPIGFICDHVEVLYDLDIEAANVCREVGLPMARAAAVNHHPAFIDTMADAVLGVIERYAGSRPLQVATS